MKPCLRTVCKVIRIHLWVELLCSPVGLRLPSTVVVLAFSLSSWHSWSAILVGKVFWEIFGR